MTDADKLAIIGLLTITRPKVAIEIGTCDGGCAAILNDYVKTLYCVDIRPEVGNPLMTLRNVTFLCGRSQDIIPTLLGDLSRRQVPWDFIIVDGGHSISTVKGDIEGILSVRPLSRVHVIFHDSFNPSVRKALETFDWEGSPHVHVVDLDFVPGYIYPNGVHDDGKAALWHGLALVVLDREPRTTRLELDEGYRPCYRQLRSITRQFNDPRLRLGFSSAGEEFYQSPATPKVGYRRGMRSRRLTLDFRRRRHCVARANHLV